MVILSPTAVQNARDAVTLTPERDPNRAGRLSNLSVFLRERYEREGKLDDLVLRVLKLSADHEVLRPLLIDLPAKWMGPSNLGNDYQFAIKSVPIETELSVICLVFKPRS